MKSLVIVESPTKAKTISKFLGKDYIVKASMGHIRDLPATASDIPLKYKKEKWARLGIDIANDFEPLYVVGSKKKKILSELKKLMAECGELILATDEDREGEAISWHLNELLAPKNKDTKRIAFHEITKTAIDEALSHPRTVNMQVVQAQETRRFLDRLVGYGVSPLLWKKIRFGLSAGRVQSVALKIIVEREEERMAFVVSTYNSIDAELETTKSEKFKSKLIKYQNLDVATSNDFDEQNGRLLASKAEKLFLITDENSKSVIDFIKSSKLSISKIEQNLEKKFPSAPYITSSLQIDANRKLGFSSKQTMMVAQKLYEQGFITYMRTDSVNIADAALTGIKKKIISKFGSEYYIGFAKKYKSKSKNAQEAHEAIRPAGVEFNTGEELGLIGEQLSLYNLIWRRTVATQMKEAVYDMTSVDIEDSKKSLLFRSNGMTIKFDGFLKAYKTTESESQILPDLQMAELTNISKIDSVSHETKPPARFNDASLVKKLEAEGVGRPSTYASIISTIQARGYVTRVGNQLIPTFTGFAVNNYVAEGFTDLVDVKFTAKMEDDLDDIETGKLLWKPYLKNFYLGEKGFKSKMELEDKKGLQKDMNRLDLRQIDKQYEIHIGQYGPYVIKFNNNVEVGRGSIPADVFPSDITNEKIEEVLAAKLLSDKPILETGNSQVFLKSGRYGNYLQQITGKETKNVAIPKFLKVADLSKEMIEKVISLPYMLGKYNNLEIKVGYGKFGGYLIYNEKYVSIPDELLFTIDVNQAIDFIETAKNKAPTNRGRAKKILKDFGKIDKKSMQILDGQYGNYVKWGTKNYTIEKGLDIQALTVEYIKDNIVNK